MAHSPVTRVIYPPLNRADLQSYRNDIIVYERRLEEGERDKELPEVLMNDVSTLVDYAEFLEYKLEAKNRELKRQLNEYSKLLAAHEALKSKMAEEQSSSADTETNEENKNDPKGQESANPRKREHENDESTDKVDEKRVCVAAPSGTDSPGHVSEMEDSMDIDENDNPAPTSGPAVPTLGAAAPTPAANDDDDSWHEVRRRIAALKKREVRVQAALELEAFGNGETGLLARR
ncbi:hypothetical protein MMC07_005321 [Pseudocyphellaria aurata]|nr:hypothetical protein [Pseudocyphellaria aurata]